MIATNSSPRWRRTSRPCWTCCPRKTTAQDVRDFLDGFPRQYLKITPKSDIAEHFTLSRKLESVPMVTHLARRDGRIYEVLVMAADRLFLFSKITGVLSYFGMNILRGQAFSNRHGTIFDLITFEDVDNYFAKNPSEVERFSKVLKDVIDGNTDLNKLLQGKMTSILFRQKKKGGHSVTDSLRRRVLGSLHDSGDRHAGRVRPAVPNWHGSFLTRLQY